MKRIISALAGLLLLSAGSAFAQCQRVIENGTVQNNMPVVWVAPCVIGQAGPSSGSSGIAPSGLPMIKDLGVQGTIGILDATTIGPFHWALLRWSPTVSGEFDIDLSGLGGASPASAAYIINGIKYPIPFTGAGIIIQHVPTTAVLKALTVTVGGVAIRTGVNSDGDSPEIVYTLFAGACSLNSGAGDGGTEIPSDISGCWKAHLLGGWDVRVFGATIASTDNAAIFSTIDASAKALGGAQIVIPAGTWTVLSTPVFSGLNQWVLQPGAQLAGAGALTTQVAMLGGALLGPSTFNPNIYDTYSGASTLSQNILYSANGSMTISNPVPHGILQSRSALSVSSGGSTDTNNDITECYSGIADSSPASLSAVWLDTGPGTACIIANAKAPLTIKGTFTSNTFVPTTPFLPSALPGGGLPPKDVWIISQDDPPYVGLSTGTTLNGSGQVTSITVGGWVQPGQSSFATPASSVAELNFNSILFADNSKALLTKLNGMNVTTNGTATVTIAGTDLALVSKFDFIGDGGVKIPLNAVIMSIDPITGVATIDPPATGSETAVSATIATLPFNMGQVAEDDNRNHSGFSFDPTIWPETGTVAIGSNQVTAVSDIADLRVGMTCSGTNLGSSIILAINRGANSFTKHVNNTVTGSATFNCFWGYQTGNAGRVASSQDKTSAADWIARGHGFAGFLAMGADEDAFLAGRNTSSDGHFDWAFRSDHTFRIPQACDFAVTTGEQASYDPSTFWCLGNSMETFNTSGVLLPNAVTSNFLIRMGSLTGGPIINTISFTGLGTYFVPSASHGTPAAQATLRSGDVIGGIQLGGFDGTAWDYSDGFLDGRPAGTWSVSSHPTNWTFATTATNSTTPRIVMQVERDGTWLSLRGASAPTVSSGAGACGTSPTVVGSPMGGLITVGSSTVGTTCTVSWQGDNTPTDQIPHCTITDRDTAVLIRMTASNTSGFTFAGAIVAGDHLDYQCTYVN